MGALTLDATVLIGLLDREDAHHAGAISDLEEAEARGATLAAPASAYSEALVGWARVGRTAEAVAAIEAMGIAVLPLTADIAERAAAWRARRATLRLPDALVLATADHLGGDLLTYDERLRRLAP